MSTEDNTIGTEDNIIGAEDNIIGAEDNIIDAEDNVIDTEDNILIPTPAWEELKPAIPYMNNIIRVSKIISMWPESKKPQSFFYHFRVWFVITHSVLMIAGFGIRIAENVAYLDSVSVLVDFTTVFISGTFRYIHIYVKGEKYLHLVSLIHNNFIQYSLFPKESRSSVLKYYKIGNKLFVAYGTFVVSWVLQLCTVPLISYFWKMSKLPSGLNETLVEPIQYPVVMKAYAPFDYYVQPNNVLFYIYQFSSFLTMCCIYVSVDCFWYTVILLTIGQFALLKESVDTISEILSKDEQTEYQPLRETELQSLREGLKHCIRRHQFTREFIRLVEELSNPLVLVDTVHVLISVGFMMLDVIVAINISDWNRAMYSLEYFITSVVHMYCFDWLGNELSVQEEEVAAAIHKIPWYKCPTEKPLLIVMSLQARKPFKLTGGRIFKLGLEFFTNTLKTVFSVFTFLLTMRDR